MSDINANVVVSMPSQLFTLARSFKAAANGAIYIGLIDTDPTIPSNQIQVYLENEDGTHVAVSQPLAINAGGFPVYNGEVAKFVTVKGHSMAVYDSYGTQQFYYPNVLKYDPDQLRQDLASDADGVGDSLVSVKKTGSGTVPRTQHDINNDLYYVEDYWLESDGDNYSAAVKRMHADKGYARFLDKKTYNLTGLQMTITNMALLGGGRPRYSGGTAVPGTGTILIGMFNHSVTNARISDLGHIAVTDGIVVNSGVGSASPGKLYVENVLSVGTGEAGSSHAQLYQGFNDVYIHEAEGNDAQYGVVVKSRSGFVKNITCRNTRTSGIFIKGDQGVPSGNVANGAAADIIIDGLNVVNNSSNTGCSALFIQSSTDLASKVIASKIRATYGKTALEIAGGGTGALQTNSIIVSDIISEATATSAVLVTGNTSDFIIKGVLAINPSNGSAVNTGGSANNGLISDISLVISNSAITGTLAGFIDGTAMKLGQFMVRNPYRKMAVQIGRGRVNAGSLTGDVSYQGDGNIAVLNGAAWGATIPSVETREGNATVLHGSILTTGVSIASSPVIGTMPFSIPVSMVIEASIRLRDGTYGSTRLYISGTILQLLTGSATTVGEVFLEGLTINLPKV